MSSSRAELKMLNPWKFYRVTMSMRMDYYNPVFLGLCFTEKYARLAISDDSISIASIYRSCSGFPIDNTLLDKLVDFIESLKNDRVEKYELLGIIVANNNSNVPRIHDLMDGLWKKANLKSLKYTCWRDDFVSANLACECKALRNSFPVVKHQRLHERSEKFSAAYMLQTFLDFFRALYMNKFTGMKDEDKEREVEDEEMEDYERKVHTSVRLLHSLEDEEMEDSERKMIKYLKPLQFFRETMERDHHRTLLLGLSVTDERVRVVICFDRLNELSHDDLLVFPKDETYLDTLVDAIQHFQNDGVEERELVGIIVDTNNSDKKIHNLMDAICKKLNFESLKYTCWKDDFALENPPFECNQFGSLFWGITIPVEYSDSELLGHFSTHHMIRSYLGFFSTLCRDEDKEWEAKDLEDSKRKKRCRICIQYYRCCPWMFVST